MEYERSQDGTAGVRNAGAPDPELDLLVEQIAVLDAERKRVLDELRRPAGTLVPETAFEEDFDDDQQVETTPNAVDESLVKLQVLLATAGRDATVRAPRPRSDERLLQFSIPAGRAEREVAVEAEGAQALLGDADLLTWRSLVRYDGIWNPNLGAIEVAVRTESPGPSPRFALRRLMGTDEDVRLELPGADGVRLSLGQSASIASVILSPRPGRLARRSPFTVRLDGVPVETMQDAEILIEEVADAFLFDLEVTHGISLVLKRLEDRSRPQRLLPEMRSPPRFPANRYPHAPVLLYRLGRDRSLPPVIRYWAFYQVLEYFFPKYAHEAAVQLVSRYLRSPNFDPHREEDIVKTITLSESASQTAEREDLLTTLQAITSRQELADVINRYELADRLLKSGKELSGECADTNSEELIRQLASRIYDVRCKIVHSKSSSQREAGPGLLPGTEHDDQISPEMPIMEYLAQQAIFAAAEPPR